MSRNIDIRLADWQLNDDRKAVVSLLDAYARHPMGGAEPLTEYVRENLAETMSTTPGAFSVLAWSSDEDQTEAVALANCFKTLSTFACKPLINIHDLYVAQSARSKGLGQKMLTFIEQLARTQGCCKITLEVLSGNSGAKRSYETFGFRPYRLDDVTGHAMFLQKALDR